MKNLIVFIPAPQRPDNGRGGNNDPVYYITLGGIRYGCIRRYGAVSDNQGLCVSLKTIEGMSKLLGISIEDAREVFNRELVRLTPDWKGLP